ncbi:MAG: nucleoside triphosphate pyrophosphatase [Candidatus Melainabacteria bacterium]|nr:nucleoside triphosphate pyrophosphatase [Candidatus Melainabacteria bacterium]
MQASLILASGSKARQEQLNSLGISFTVVLPSVDEAALKLTYQKIPPAEQAVLLAQAKGQAASEKHPKSWVLAGDQMAVHPDGTVLSKPGNVERALWQLQSLRGKTHTLYTAACLWKNNACIWSTLAETHLSMNYLPDEDLRKYLEADQPWDCCGAYRFEGQGKMLFNTVEGAIDAIVGLPMQAVFEAFQQYRIL